MPSAAQIIGILETTGHLRNPFGVPQAVPAVGATDYPTSLQEPAVVQAVQSYQSMHNSVIEPLIAKHYPERVSAAVRIDGQVGPAMDELFSMERCACSDYETAASTASAVGSGSWKQCHGIGEYHCAIVQIDEANMPQRLQQLHGDVTGLVAVLRIVQAAFDEVGLRFVFVNKQGIDYLTGKSFSGAPQTMLSFVTGSDGWIGLAIVPSTPQGCSTSPIWLRLLKTWIDRASIEDIATLFKHELCHNCSLGHTGGGQGVMSPYIVEGLPTSFRGDPVFNQLSQRFGGVPIPTSPSPGPGPIPPTGEGYIPDLLIEFKGKKYRAFPVAGV